LFPTFFFFSAVVSLLVGEAITKVTEAHPDITGPEVAACLSIVCGVITLLMGMIRLGILVDFISGN
jgi:sodium-independent sulfate anion transporter 11